MGRWFQQKIVKNLGSGAKAKFLKNHRPQLARPFCGPRQRGDTLQRHKHSSSNAHTAGTSTQSPQAHADWHEHLAAAPAGAPARNPQQIAMAPAVAPARNFQCAHCHKHLVAAPCSGTSTQAPQAHPAINGTPKLQARTATHLAAAPCSAAAPAPKLRSSGQHPSSKVHTRTSSYT